MGNSYNETHQDILESAKLNFLKFGYERSNLRTICKGANVTTGAFYRHFKGKDEVFDELVSKAIKELKKIYYISEDTLYKTIEEQDINEFWDMNDEAILSFVDLIYKYYDEFRLVLLFSDGTKYEHFLHDISDIETKNTLKFMKFLKEKNYNVKELSEKEIHMLINAYMSSIFEVIAHEYSQEEAFKCIKTVVEFYKIGWKSVFGL